MKTLRMMTDEELVVLYAEGNNAAFDVLLNRYKSSIHSITKISQKISFRRLLSR